MTCPAPTAGVAVGVGRGLVVGVAPFGNGSVAEAIVVGASVPAVGAMIGARVGVGGDDKVGGGVTTAKAGVGLAPAEVSNELTPALTAAPTTVAKRTNRLARKPLDSMRRMVLGQNPLAEVLFLQRHQIGGCELPDQVKKVT